MLANRLFIRKNMKYIDDLSYSNIVGLIDGEEIKGADVLNSIALEMEENDKDRKSVV